MPTQIPQQQLQPANKQAQQQGPEGPGMAREFAENPSMEILKERRIDQLVAKKESERIAIAQGMKQAEERGRQEGEAIGYSNGEKEGFMNGATNGLEHGYSRGLEHGSLGLGRSIAQEQIN